MTDPDIIWAFQDKSLEVLDRFYCFGRTEHDNFKSHLFKLFFALGFGILDHNTKEGTRIV